MTNWIIFYLVSKTSRMPKRMRYIFLATTSIPKSLTVEILQSTMLSKGTFHPQNVFSDGLQQKIYSNILCVSVCVIVLVIFLRFSCCYIFALKSKFSGAFSLLEASFNNPSLECFQISLQPTFTFSTLSHLLLISSHSTFTFSLSVTILSLPLSFPPISHSRRDYCCD